MEDEKIVPIEKISGYQAGEVSGNENLGFDDSDLNEFSLGFINEEKHGDEDELASSSSFQVVEEVKVNHGMFVSTRQVANTFFHQIMPSQTVQVHLNPNLSMKKEIFSLKEIVRAIVFLLMVCCLHVEGDGKSRLMMEDKKKKREDGCVIKVNGEGLIAFLKKVGVFLTISLAVCTMWANHILLVTP